MTLDDLILALGERKVRALVRSGAASGAVQLTAGERALVLGRTRQRGAGEPQEASR